MIPAVLLTRIAPVAADKRVGGNRAEILRILPQLDPGDILSARVEARLPDGRYKVVVSGQRLSMALLAHGARGGTLELAVVAREPRLAFVRKAIQPAASAPAPELSAAGRLVAATILQPGGRAVPVTVSAAAPLPTTQPDDGARLSSVLAQALTESGLFYESHQAEWVAGKRDLALIRQEPQARLGPDPRAREASAATLDTPDAVPAQSREQSIHPRSVPLVQQQLAALDGARILLQIEIWPRQWMHWEIEQRQPGAERERNAAQCWNTRLRLKLPQLGDLKAALSLANDGVRIMLETAGDASTALFREHLGSLRDALAAAGLPPAGIEIAQHAQS